MKANVAITENFNKIAEGSINLLKKAGSWLRSKLPDETETGLDDYTNISAEPITLRRLGRRKRGRVIGGENVEKSTDFPSYVSIRLHGTHVCGGTIINCDTVLTAAHCKERMKVVSIWFQRRIFYF